jgi:hypothetical protein
MIFLDLPRVASARRQLTPRRLYTLESENGRRYEERCSAGKLRH